MPMLLEITIDNVHTNNFTCHLPPNNEKATEMMNNQIKIILFD